VDSVQVTPQTQSAQCYDLNTLMIPNEFIFSMLSLKQLYSSIYIVLFTVKILQYMHYLSERVTTNYDL